jgi:YVTN family beta-propeller protein
VSADSATRSPGPAEPTTQGDAQRPGRRRRLVTIASVAAATALVVGAPAAVFGLADSSHAGGDAAPARSGQRSQSLSASADPTDYHAYVAAATGEVIEADVATGSVIGEISANSPEGVAATPDGSQLFIAQTGQYSVVAVNTATKAQTTIEVGPYPQDVAVSPDGSTVYATVTGGDTGPGGSNVVAVISTATDTVTGDITVGTGPRQVAFAPDGSRAYVTTEQGVDAIDTATGQVVYSVPIPGGAQGLAVSPDGSRLYVTSPPTDSLWVINADSGAVVTHVAAGPEPYSVAVTPDGATAYVADTNSNSVRAISTAGFATIATISVGGLPGVVAVTPDGSQVWVGNMLTGNVTVINPATNTVSGTISAGSGTATLNAEPFSIAFVSVSS